MEIGRIVKSNSHLEFVCQANEAGESSTPPARKDYAFGKLLAVEIENGFDLVTAVFDTILLNPDFGMAGPRLSPTDSERLAPDQFAETATLIGLIGLGTLSRDGQATHGVPPTTPTVGARVRNMKAEEIRSFHLPGGKFAAAYMPHLLAHSSPLMREVVLTLFDELAAIFPDQSAAIAVVRGNLAWQMKVQQAP